MSNNTMWVSASTDFKLVDPHEYTDNNGSTNDNHVLLFGEVVAMEGTPAEIEAALVRALTVMRSAV